MKELDLILEAWLAQGYGQASPAERTLFAAFLELPDPQIAGYLLAHDTPTDPALAALVAQLTTARH
jgi:succinate dehydrogenase flavin-adding protein (antitoxin of CptAB toxin-antitoxin module)